MSLRSRSVKTLDSGIASKCLMAKVKLFIHGSCRMKASSGINQGKYIGNPPPPPRNKNRPIWGKNLRGMRKTGEKGKRNKANKGVWMVIFGKGTSIVLGGYKRTKRWFSNHYIDPWSGSSLPKITATKTASTLW
jgi:hypothetical protein